MNISKILEKMNVQRQFFCQFSFSLKAERLNSLQPLRLDIELWFFMNFRDTTELTAL